MPKLQKINSKLSSLIKDEHKFLMEKNFLREALMIKDWLLELEDLRKKTKKKSRSKRKSKKKSAT